MKSRQGEPGRSGATCREHRHTARRARIDGDERMVEEGLLQVVARQVMIEIPREPIIGHKDVRLAAQAPPQGRVRLRPGAGAGKSLRQ